MSSLESLLMSHEKEERKNPKAAKVRRKFIIAEALYTNTGEICPVDQLIKFKWRFAARIFLEESNSFGVLGATGKGITEHLNLDPVDIDLITAELERSVGSIGGFCAGTTYVIDHQVWLIVTFLKFLTFFMNLAIKRRRLLFLRLTTALLSAHCRLRY